jgi:citrate lyase subunit beta/citryl-CoA lyase
VRTDAGQAVTWLFVPGDRPDRFDKARHAGADEVICDLEDAVVPDGKQRARADVRDWLGAGGAAWVRINAVGTPWHEADLAVLAGLPGLRGIMVPKSESADALIAVSEAIGGGIGDRIGDGISGEIGLIALIESALGVHHAHDIANCPAVTRLAFGSIDFAVDIDAEESDDSLLLARSMLVIASRVAGKPAPIDSVTTVLDDPELVGAAARRARRAGFGGKLCIHPAQLAPVTAGFRPSDDEVRWATAVVRAAAESGAGAGVVGGAMIDKPVLERAQRILVRSEPLAEPYEEGR